MVFQGWTRVFSFIVCENHLIGAEIVDFPGRNYIIASILGGSELLVGCPSIIVRRSICGRSDIRVFTHCLHSSTTELLKQR